MGPVFVITKITYEYCRNLGNVVKSKRKKIALIVLYPVISRNITVTPLLYIFPVFLSIFLEKKKETAVCIILKTFLCP